jgi:hypothetical protein
MENKILLAQFLRKRRAEISRSRNLPIDEQVPWRDLAIEAGVPENNLFRWKDGAGLPSYEYMPKLAHLFGAEVYEVTGYPPPMPTDLDPDFVWLMRHRSNPNVAAVIAEARQKAEQRLKADRTVRNAVVTT